MCTEGGEQEELNSKVRLGPLKWTSGTWGYVTAWLEHQWHCQAGNKLGTEFRSDEKLNRKEMPTRGLYAQKLDSLPLLTS